MEVCVDGSGDDSQLRVSTPVDKPLLLIDIFRGLLLSFFVRRLIRWAFLNSLMGFPLRPRPF